MTTAFRGVGDNDDQVHRLDSGKWQDQTFPRDGWRFSTFKDAGTAHIRCEMCLNARVRFAHTLVHAKVPEGILVGLMCAEALQKDDYYGPERREREYRDDLRIRNDWHKRKWKTSKIGNAYINARGFNISIWRKGAGYGVTIRVENRFEDEFVRNDPKMYMNLKEAKLGALDRLMEARAELRRQG
ncbi:hypothetical protein HNR26_002994 [Rhizobium rosettiformans]|uniref:Uncharacterized protein n=2 Tax=Rhizobium rosettiformans TaxID=1368430 RepID=A0A4S8PW35_9HYPH|nr:hypothetical protein [Rhizobium rosettiformans]MBB5276916.1 hypothetical protein [Rhizobium rosettiformans]THV34731.1 hypothetical protein FAA86_13675 [Rhizobium rosettiformans W3]